VSLLCNQALVLHRYVIHLAQKTGKIVGWVKPYRYPCVCWVRYFSMQLQHI